MEVINLRSILEENIRKYMGQKGFKYYTDVLIAIAKLCGKKQDEAIAFASREKSNFSKMLKGERPLKYDFIIPLESLFGVSLAKLTSVQAYHEEINKDDIKFLKSFRYFAYKDDPKHYEEMDKYYTCDGSDYLTNSDEFNRFFIDYLIEYKSYNGLRYLVNKRNFKFNNLVENYWMDNSAAIFSNKPISLAKFIVDSNDRELFEKIYDPFQYLMLYYQENIDSQFLNEKFIDSILHNTEIFESLFSTRVFPFELINKGIEPKDGLKPNITCINPLLNVCLDYCLNNLDEYNNEAKTILKYGIEWNNEVFHNLEASKFNKFECEVDGIGNLRIGWRYYFSNIIRVNVSDTKNNEINNLISRLPKIVKRRKP